MRLPNDCRTTVFVYSCSLKILFLFRALFPAAECPGSTLDKCGICNRQGRIFSEYPTSVLPCQVKLHQCSICISLPELVQYKYLQRLQYRGTESYSILTRKTCNDLLCSRNNSTKSPFLGAGNVGKRQMMSQVYSSVRVYCVSVVESVEVPVFVCLLCWCSHVTEVGGPRGL
jgi:hypothetical protein